MQILIDIPEEEYKCVQITGCIGNKTCISNAIYNGTLFQQEPCEDCISRAKLIQKIDAWDHNVNAIPNYVWKVIREAPPVTSAGKVGHWYKKPHEICYTCDQCRTTNASGVKYNFCPHCGACMKEGGEG